MTNKTSQIKKTKSAALKALTVLALAGSLGLITMNSASADPHGHVAPHRHWDDHARHNADWYRIHPGYYPGYVAAPPVAVYAPPPPSPGISLVLPINIR